MARTARPASPATAIPLRPDAFAHLNRNRKALRDGFTRRCGRLRIASAVSQIPWPDACSPPAQYNVTSAIHALLLPTVDYQSRPQAVPNPADQNSSSLTENKHPPSLSIANFHHFVLALGSYTHRAIRREKRRPRACARRILRLGRARPHARALRLTRGPSPAGKFINVLFAIGPGCGPRGVRSGSRNPEECGSASGDKGSGPAVSHGFGATSNQGRLQWPEIWVGCFRAMG